MTSGFTFPEILVQRSKKEIGRLKKKKRCFNLAKIRAAVNHCYPDHVRVYVCIYTHTRACLWVPKAVDTFLKLNLDLFCLRQTRPGSGLEEYIKGIVLSFFTKSTMCGLLPSSAVFVSRGSGSLQTSLILFYFFPFLLLTSKQQDALHLRPIVEVFVVLNIWVYFLAKWQILDRDPLDSF